jgi:hypothetical protein
MTLYYNLKVLKYMHYIFYIMGYCCRSLFALQNESGTACGRLEIDGGGTPGA